MRAMIVQACSSLCIAMLAVVSSGCGASGSGDWYYHWSCNGDSECLSTNPTGAASGTQDEGPSEASCTSLLTFAAHFWGSAATDSCDQSAAGGGNAGGAGGGSGGGAGGGSGGSSLAIINTTNTYWLCGGNQSPFNLFLAQTVSGSGTGLYQRVTTPPSLIGGFTWQEGSDGSSIVASSIGAAFPGLNGIKPNIVPSPTRFSYTGETGDCILTAGTLPGVPQDLAAGFIAQGGLTWMPNTLAGALAWPAANTYCSTNTINASTGWRLPAPAELVGLFSAGSITSAEMGLGWASVSLGGGATPTWTSDSAVAGSHQAYSELDLAGGGTTSADSTVYQVTCVK